MQTNYEKLDSLNKEFYRVVKIVVLTIRENWIQGS
jgi:hypothetical protein